MFGAIQRISGFENLFLEFGVAFGLVHEAVVVKIIEGAIGTHGIHFNCGHAVDGFSKIIGLLYGGSYLSDEIVVAGDVGSEMFDGLSIDVSFLVVSVIFYFVEGIVVKIVVYEMVQPSHK